MIDNLPQPRMLSETEARHLVRAEEDSMTTAPAANRLENLWDDARAASMTEAEKLLYRSNLLGSDKRVTTYGGGNTSVKVMEKDPLTSQMA